jgi:hypothetical protein
MEKYPEIHTKATSNLEPQNSSIKVFALVLRLLKVTFLFKPLGIRL